MAMPKRRHSKARTAKRRSQWKLRAIGLHDCPKCHEPKQPHRVCDNCGSYNGREVIEKKASE